jgi:magnesium-transporting ATPase (P-type)
MKFESINLPSNRKFGFFFSAILIIFGTYFFYKDWYFFMYSFYFISLIFFITALFKDKLLLPFNKAWMKFGLFLGSIVSPIVLGIIFFGLFSPYGIIMRIMKRDELRLRKIDNESYWLYRSSRSQKTDFEKQY